MNKNTTETPVLTADTLRRAADLAELIQQKQAELNALLAGQVVASEDSGDGTKKRKLSPKAIAAIRAGQKRRWEKANAQKVAAPVVITEPPCGTPVGSTSAGIELPPLEPTT